MTRVTMMKRQTLRGQRRRMLLKSSKEEMSANLNRSVKVGIASTVSDFTNYIFISNYNVLTCQNIIHFGPYHTVGHTQLQKQSFQFISELGAFILKLYMYRGITSLGKYRQSIQNLRRSLQETDPQIYQLALSEKQRQFKGINLIASENYCSNACMTAVSSVFNNKYSQGYPGARYYGGTQFTDKLQLLCQQRALKAFGLSDQEWGTNVQGLSGSPANMAVFTGLLNPHDRIMSLDLPHGGHLSHGFQAGGKKISATSKYFEVFPYKLDESTGLIDYESLHKIAQIYRPKLIIAGTSAYSRLIDYKKFREISDQIGAYLMCDMAHPAGLMSAGIIPSPFEYADVVTTTTHKTLRGTRGSLIFYQVGTRKDKKGNDVKIELKSKIDAALFPGLQGGPHMHSIAGIAVALGQACTPEFREYQVQVLKNSQASCEYLKSKGHTIVSGGTDNHLFVVDMRSKGTDGSKIETVMDEVELAINKNTVPGDKSPLLPSGIRIGSPAMTTRGCKESDFIEIMKFLERTTDIVNNVSKKVKGKRLKDFKDALQGEFGNADISSLRKDVSDFASRFPPPGGVI